MRAGARALSMRKPPFCGWSMIYCPLVRGEQPMYAVPDVEKRGRVAGTGDPPGARGGRPVSEVPPATAGSSTPSCRRGWRSPGRRCLGRTAARIPAAARRRPAQRLDGSATSRGAADGLLAGKTVSYKDHIAVAGMPMSRPSPSKVLSPTLMPPWSPGCWVQAGAPSSARTS